MPIKKPSGKKGGNREIALTDQDWATIENACKIQCTGEEIASLLGISYDSLERRVKAKFKISCADYIKMKSAGGKASLRRLQWESAKGGNATMQIWLGKQYLNQTDGNQTPPDGLTAALNQVLDRLPS